LAAGSQQEESANRPETDAVPEAVLPPADAGHTSPIHFSISHPTHSPGYFQRRHAVAINTFRTTKWQTFHQREELTFKFQKQKKPGKTAFPQSDSLLATIFCTYPERILGGRPSANTDNSDY
jgi:hypothetical protein